MLLLLTITDMKTILTQFLKDAKTIEETYPGQVTQALLTLAQALTTHNNTLI